MKTIATAFSFSTAAGTTHNWTFYENNNCFFAERDDDRKSLDFTSRTDLDKSVAWFKSVGFTVEYRR